MTNDPPLTPNQCRRILSRIAATSATQDADRIAAVAVLWKMDPANNATPVDRPHAPRKWWKWWAR